MQPAASTRRCARPPPAFPRPPGLVGPACAAGAADPSARCPPQVRKVAVLALCKMMCVSKPFCEANIQLLFTVLHKVPPLPPPPA